METVRNILRRVESARTKDENTKVEVKLEEAETASKMFASWDVNNDGKLSHGEVKKAMKNDSILRSMIDKTFSCAMSRNRGMFVRM